MAFRNKNGLLLMLATVLGSLTPVFAKVTVAEISPLSLGFFRFGTAAVLFYITLKIKKGNRRHLPKVYSRELPRLSSGPSAGLPRVYDIEIDDLAR